MAEQRPYRPEARDTRLGNAVALVFFAGGALALNWWLTLYMAGVMGQNPALGPHRYPLNWMVWAARWWSYPPLHPYWIWAVEVELIGIGMAGFTAMLGARLYHLQVHGLRADLHGSARWARARDLRRAHLLPERGWFREKPQGRGIYVGKWRGRLLKDSGEGHVMVCAPTRTGKGAGVVLPTLLSWDSSVFVNDIKGENWALTAGWRKSRGHKVLKFDPCNPSDEGVKFNPLDEIRKGTPYEYADAENLATALIYPDGDREDDYWHQSAVPLLTGCILHVINEGSDPTLHGVQALFANPDRSRDETIKALLKSSHRQVAACIREFYDKAEKEASGVCSQMMTTLSLYRDPIVERNTAYSEFRIDDLMNADNPVSLYMVIQFRDQLRLKRLVRVLIQQIIHHFTGAMKFKDGRAVNEYRHPLLMMLDEFPALGRFGILEHALALVAGYGIRMVVVAQDITQIKATYGPHESITQGCATKVVFTPNNHETAKRWSDEAGMTTVRREQRTRMSGGRVTESEPETSRALIDGHEVRTLDPQIALIYPHGCPAVFARKIRHWQIPALDRRAKIEPPAMSDRLRQPPAKAAKPARKKLELVQQTLV